MARNTKKHLSGLQFTEVALFPENPTAGITAFKDGVLYIYSTVDGLTTWFPLNQPPSIYVHSQGAASLTWEVHHNLGTEHVLVDVYDNANKQITVDVENVQDGVTGEWYTVITLAEADVGYAVVAGSAALNASEIAAHNLNVGGSLKVDGVAVVTETDLAAALDELRAEFAAV